MQPRETLLERIRAWADTCPDIQALALVGSGARAEQPADEWSDIDLVLLTTDPERYLQAEGWSAEISSPWIETVEQDGAGKIVERRVLFRCGVDVDFIVLSPGQLAALGAEPLAGILRRGMRVLLDKAGLLASFPAGEREDQPPGPPAAAEFSRVTSDFWFHAAWTAKKIRRGELWTAKSCCDVYMKRLLLTMLEWRALAAGVRDPWYNGRFIERWAPAGVLERLPGIFAHYDAADIRTALLNTMDLFDTTARETARRWAHDYPEEEAQSITAWVRRLLLADR